MGTTAQPLRSCPTCGSMESRKTETQAVPGGTDWRYYECEDCGYEWRT